MPVHTNSLKNLERGIDTRFTPETAPKGRKNAGLSMIEYMNAMAEWTRADVEEVKNDETAPLIKRRAADRLLDETDVWNVVEHTNHRPLNKSETTIHDDTPRTEAERAAERDRVLARIRSRISRSA